MLLRCGVRAALLMVLVACGSTPPSSLPTAPPVPPSNETRGCNDAATGIERGTRGLREPEVSVLESMRVRCHDDAWPAVAIDCFAELTEDDLGRCAGMLDEPERERMLAALGNGYQDRVAITVAIGRLASLKVGIAECDRFVAVVASVLACEQMPIETRVELANETTDFWSLPTDRLSADAQRRMATVCGQSLAALEQRAAGAGCKP